MIGENEDRSTGPRIYIGRHASAAERVKDLLPEEGGVFRVENESADRRA